MVLFNTYGGRTYKSLSGDGNPAYITVAKVAKALGVRLAAHIVPLAV